MYLCTLCPGPLILHELVIPQLIYRRTVPCSCCSSHLLCDGRLAQTGMHDSVTMQAQGHMEHGVGKVQVPLQVPVPETVPKMNLEGNIAESPFFLNEAVNQRIECSCSGNVAERRPVDAPECFAEGTDAQWGCKLLHVVASSRIQGQDRVRGGHAMEVALIVCVASKLVVVVNPDKAKAGQLGLCHIEDIFSKHVIVQVWS
mmetsp:Transcript_147492/g.410860  ORF Transcript_147492/g.410860 Transcript_147492/m.410860 type:complete len:201 (+) Transcript_147492:448-1050(+)